MSGRQQELWVTRLGRIDYDEALELQHRLRDARAARSIPDTLLLLEHPPVYTRGRRSEDSELPMAADWYAAQGIQIRNVDRGGKVTYHGPGQLVGYPILDTAIVNRDVPRLVGTLEQSVIAALADEGVAARPDPAGRGIWAGEGAVVGKIGSIGLHVAGGITTHGFAVNVDNDLQPFTWIRPCGLDDAATSITELTGNSGRMRCFSKRTAYALATRLGLRQRLVSRDRLIEATEPVRADALVPSI
jgi:lipoate-protein ligase B